MEKTQKIIDSLEGYQNINQNDNQTVNPEQKLFEILEQLKISIPQDENKNRVSVTKNGSVVLSNNEYNSLINEIQNYEDTIATLEQKVQEKNDQNTYELGQNNISFNNVEKECNISFLDPDENHSYLNQNQTSDNHAVTLSSEEYMKLINELEGNEHCISELMVQNENLNNDVCYYKSKEQADLEEYLEQSAGINKNHHRTQSQFYKEQELSKKLIEIQIEYENLQEDHEKLNYQLHNMNSEIGNKEDLLNEKEKDLDLLKNDLENETNKIQKLESSLKNKDDKYYELEKEQLSKNMTKKMIEDDLDRKCTEFKQETMKLKENIFESKLLKEKLELDNEKLVQVLKLKQEQGDELRKSLIPLASLENSKTNSNFKKKQVKSSGKHIRYNSQISLGNYVSNQLELSKIEENSDQKKKQENVFNFSENYIINNNHNKLQPEFGQETSHIQHFRSNNNSVLSKNENLINKFQNSHIQNFRSNNNSVMSRNDNLLNKLQDLLSEQSFKYDLGEKVSFGGCSNFNQTPRDRISNIKLDLKNNDRNKKFAFVCRDTENLLDTVFP